MGVEAGIHATGVLARAVAEGRDSLLEPETFALVSALGFRVPRQLFVHGAAGVAHADLTVLGGDRVVVKVASPAILHKTDVGGVNVVPATPTAVVRAVRDMSERLAEYPLAGFTIQEFVPHPERVGAELLVALRHTEDFGPVVSLGAGGVHAELFGRHLRAGDGLAMFVRGEAPDAWERTLRAKPVLRLAVGGGRDRHPLIEPDVLLALVRLLLDFAESPDGAGVAELEINPLALTPSGPVALDALVTLRRAPRPTAAPRPLAKLRHLLRPERIALVGVSEGDNPGRVILRNLLRGGFAPDRVLLVKPGAAEIEGVRCWPTLEALPHAVDVCVLAVGAPQVPGLLRAIVTHRRAEGVIVIPGGLGETAGSEGLAEEVARTLAEARATSWGGPLVNGGNCLGIRSAPGGYDTTFIPDYKLPPPAAEAAPLAFIAQSGAFAVARWSKLAGLSPRYLISVGNQLDLTVGDYLTYLKDDPEVRVFACYVEGFRPGDGRRWLAAARAIVASGRTVLLYRGARTTAGVRAGASHTAAIAGDYAVTLELARTAGVLVADTLDEFDDWLRVFTLLDDRPARGRRLGAVSNAGFECVAIADAMAGLEPGRLGPDTTRRIVTALAAGGLEGVVSTQLPLDLTPTMDATGYETCVRAVLEDDGVDVGVVGCVPLTPALATLPAGAGHAEDAARADALAARLGRLRHTVRKPWVAVVDAGSGYDALVSLLEAARIPTFRSADRAVRALAAYCAPRPACTGEDTT
ncbi:MAG: acetate--CoA ligase family protein [Gemmatimonadota bacterium]|nr:acetate--CoA ligase family protein [Gemmatimonadota bacterium]